MSNRTAIALPSNRAMDTRALIERLIATGALKVTRCPEHVRTNLNPRKQGGVMPAHLNPLTMGDARDA